MTILGLTVRDYSFGTLLLGGALAVGCGSAMDMPHNADPSGSAGDAGEGGSAGDTGSAGDAGEAGAAGDANAGGDGGSAGSGAAAGDGGSAGSGGTAGSGGVDCDDLCPKAGATLCEDGDRQTCIEAAEGCLAWSEATPCPSGFCASDAECGECVHACDENETECVDAAHQRSCGQDANGCRIWETPEKCAKGDCENAACNPDCDQCVAGTTECKIDSVKECVAGSNVCYDWSESSLCNSGFCSDDGTSCGACKHECDAQPRYCTPTGELSVCDTDANGCRVWGTPEECGDHASCQDGFFEGFCMCDRPYEGDGDTCELPARTALLLNGGHSRVEVAYDSRFNLGANFAMEAWVYVIDWSAGEFITNRWAYGAEDKFLGFLGAAHTPASWFYKSGRVTFGTRSSEGAPTLGAWHHVAVSAGGGTIRMFMDGELVDERSGAADPLDSKSTLYIGAAYRQGSWRPGFHGYISDFRISSSNRYTAAFTPVTDLTADRDTSVLWKFDEGSGTSVYDEKANIVGTVAGGATWASAPGR